MIIDGRHIADTVLARTKERAARLKKAPTVIGYVLNIQSPATRSYLNIKRKSAERAGCVFFERASVEPLSEKELGIVQFPTELSQQEIDTLLPLERDPDVLSTAAREKFARGEEGALLPPVVAAVAEIFDLYRVDTKGKRAVVIGAGFLVGTPMAVWLRLQGSEVIVVTTESKSEYLAAALRAADIVVSGAGSPHFIKPEMLKEGVVLIDAGTSESSGKLAGDADPSCAEKCALFTPVPGGVGPVAVAKLFENATLLAERNLYF